MHITWSHLSALLLSIGLGVSAGRNSREPTFSVKRTGANLLQPSSKWNLPPKSLIILILRIHRRVPILCHRPLPSIQVNSTQDKTKSGALVRNYGLDPRLARPYRSFKHVDDQLWSGSSLRRGINPANAWDRRWDVPN